MWLSALVGCNEEEYTQVNVCKRFCFPEMHAMIRGKKY